ncbi:unnamed protein product [Amoebophrya sp. A120]|nr:unnamed protein product [Amoebophrya sp. A120]|eukprot:GSA120T00013510001.1
MKKATSLSTTLLGGFLLQLLHSHYTKNITSSLFITVDALKVLTSSKIKTEGKKKRADTCTCVNSNTATTTIQPWVTNNEALASPRDYPGPDLRRNVEWRLW